jgi:hypothetical protein
VLSSGVYLTFELCVLMPVLQDVVGHVHVLVSSVVSKWAVSWCVLTQVLELCAARSEQLPCNAAARLQFAMYCCVLIGDK